MTKTFVKVFYAAIAVLFLQINFVLAQGNNDWQTGGNPPTTGGGAVPAAAGGVDATNNLLGTPAGIHLRFGVNGGTEAMRILGSGNVGFVGIGLPAPAHLLDVRGTTIGTGDINCGNGTATSPQAYMIGDNRVLWHNGNTSRLYVGVEAGNATSTGANNTFVGNRAGFSNTGGSGNTFVGRRAGLSNLGPTFTFEGNWNTFTGHRSGEDNTLGWLNSFYGKEAGAFNTTGIWNVYVGAHAATRDGNLGGASDGDRNTFVGTYSGELYNGNNNVFIGHKTGSVQCETKTDGIKNTYVGDESMSNTLLGTGAGNVFQFSTTLGANTVVGGDYSTAIGANCNAPVTRTMILGDNNINVGIGLSGDATGPRNKLEINTDDPSTVRTATTLNGAPGSATGFSGLRFRDLTTLSNPLVRVSTNQ